jgi:hypothetical protein
MAEIKFFESIPLEGKKKRTTHIYSSMPLTELSRQKTLEELNETVYFAIPNGDMDLVKGLLNTSVTKFNGREKMGEAVDEKDSRRGNYIILERTVADYISLVNAIEKRVSFASPSNSPAPSQSYEQPLKQSEIRKEVERYHSLLGSKKMPRPLNRIPLY